MSDKQEYYIVTHEESLDYPAVYVAGSKEEAVEIYEQDHILDADDIIKVQKLWDSKVYEQRTTKKLVKVKG